MPQRDDYLRLMPSPLLSPVPEPSNGVKIAQEPMGIPNEADRRIKRPMNPFMVWAKQERPKLSAFHPGIHNAELSRLLGQNWNQLSERQKLPFRLQAERLAEKHRLEHPDYKYRPRRKDPTARRVKGRRIKQEEISRVFKGLSREEISLYMGLASKKRSVATTPSKRRIKMVDSRDEGKSALGNSTTPVLVLDSRGPPVNKQPTGTTSVDHSHEAFGPPSSMTSSAKKLGKIITCQTPAVKCESDYHWPVLKICPSPGRPEYELHESADTKQDAKSAADLHLCGLVSIAGHTSDALSAHIQLDAVPSALELSSLAQTSPYPIDALQTEDEIAPFHSLALDFPMRSSSSLSSLEDSVLDDLSCYTWDASDKCTQCISSWTPLF